MGMWEALARLQQETIMLLLQRKQCPKGRGQRKYSEGFEYNAMRLMGKASKSRFGKNRRSRDNRRASLNASLVILDYEIDIKNSRLGSHARVLESDQREAVKGHRALELSLCCPSRLAEGALRRNSGELKDTISWCMIDLVLSDRTPPASKLP